MGNPNRTQVVDGNKMMLFINTTGGTTNLKPCAFSENVKLSVTTAFRERTTKDNGVWKSFVPDKIEWNASTDTLMNLTGITGTTLSTKQLYAAYLAQNRIYVSIALAAGTTPSWTVDTTKTRFTGYAYIKNMDFNGNKNADATATIQLQGDDDLIAS